MRRLGKKSKNVNRVSSYVHGRPVSLKPSTARSDYDRAATAAAIIIINRKTLYRYNVQDVNEGDDDGGG